MAKFEVYRTKEGWLALDCQADTLSSFLNTRLVVPLMPPDEAPLAAARLNPLFTLNGDPVVMVAQFAASVPVAQFQERVGSLSAHEFEIGAALDFLISGF